MGLIGWMGKGWGEPTVDTFYKQDTTGTTSPKK